MITDTRDVRTTNGAESFHRVFNSKFAKDHPNIYKVLQVLLLFQEKSFLTFNDFENKRCNEHQKRDAERDTMTRATWAKYLSSQRTDSDLLEFLSVLGNRFQGKKL